MEAIGRPDLAANPAYATNSGRCAHRETLDAAVAAWTRTVSAREAQDRLEAAEVPCSRLYDIADCAHDPHLLARKSVLSVNDPLIGPTLHPGPAIRLDGETPEAMIGWTGPAPGAHTDYVLHELLGLPRAPAAE
jgi:formyl-CoA transferase